MNKSPLSNCAITEINIKTMYALSEKFHVAIAKENGVSRAILYKSDGITVVYCDHKKWNPGKRKDESIYETCLLSEAPFTITDEVANMEAYVARVRKSYVVGMDYDQAIQNLGEIAATESYCMPEILKNVTMKDQQLLDAHRIALTTSDTVKEYHTTVRENILQP